MSPSGSYVRLQWSLSLSRLMRPRLLVVVLSTVSRLQSSVSLLWWLSEASLSKGNGVSVKRGLLSPSMLSLLFRIELLRMLLLIPPWSYMMQLSPLLLVLLSSPCAEVSSMSPLKVSRCRRLGHMRVVVAEVILVAVVIYDEVVAAVAVGIVIVAVENVGSLRDGRKKVVAVVTSVAGIFALAY